jgi:hypothetical protein
MSQQTWWLFSCVMWGLSCVHHWLLWILKTPSWVSAASFMHKICSAKRESCSCSYTVKTKVGHLYSLVTCRSWIYFYRTCNFPLSYTWLVLHNLPTCISWINECCGGDGEEISVYHESWPQFYNSCYALYVKISLPKGRPKELVHFRILYGVQSPDSLGSSWINIFGSNSVLLIFSALKLRWNFLKWLFLKRVWFENVK